MKNQHLERFEIRLSGLGGQGILTLGKVMGSGLALGQGYNVTQTQSYGPEARGGASRSDLVISSEKISYPKAESVDLLIALSQEACNMYFRNLKPGGLLLIESDLVKQPPVNMFLGLPFTNLAKEKIGLVQTMNTIVLGAATFLLPFADHRIIRKNLEEILPAKIIEINVKAFNLGYKEAKKAFGDPETLWKNHSIVVEEEHDSI
ncbi:2-oxoacid:acceptor oxidoreductase family protein [Desulfovibrio gilichinskyi]|uniref:2-oxoglutarate ferredoxin oxidoreductase, gamma subunit n=1 Tax=Desulfovibrio gilichinskyi TaxID=1519643 RepID=A0A1X7ERV5_9BACT|nr:2-oxoacid:acceptor oxidoreductase family protein [Desulfovibrio gilichinskyi]SMF39118.1 2-oxoglutarate ferredoxin oxidoreductase, gamma subunit [Desulfovibrio gilichinskyi]